MLTKLAILCMTALSFTACDNTQAPAYPTDTITTRDGEQIGITFYKHASLAIRVGDKHIYLDPVGSFADYSTQPKADLILITHSHYDHLDTAAIAKIATPSTLILCDSTSATMLGRENRIMRPGEVASPREYVEVEAVAAYNTTPDRMQFHPRERQDCGYILTIGGTRIYVAGDSEPTPEMEALQNIDIAFLPVNQPYTMTVDQAVAAVKAFRPAVFYPYHYGEVEEKTDIDRLMGELTGITEVRIRPME